jgi:flagellar biosynthesis protein FlhA
MKIRGNLIARGELLMDRLLAINPGTVTEEIEGIITTDPAFNLPAAWITHDNREQSEILGYTVVEPISVLVTHLSEIIKSNADKLISKQVTKNMIENLKKDYPAVVEDINAEVLPLSTIQKVLQNLLKEGIPIKDLVTILESLSDYSKVTKNVDVLTEYVRHSIASLYIDEKRTIHAISIDAKIEQIITNALQSQNQNMPTLGLPSDLLKSLLNSISKCIDTSKIAGYRPIILTAATIRLYFYRLIHSTFPVVNVLSFTELPPDVEIEFIDKISIENEN